MQLQRDAGVGEEGASAVEFSIIAVPLLILLFSIIWFGILIAQDLALSNGARQGARAAAVATGNCETIVDEVVLGATGIALNTSDTVRFDVDVLLETGGADLCPGVAFPSPPAAWSTTFPCSGRPLDTEIRVVASWQGALHIPFVDASSIELQREGVYRCEYS